MGLPRSRLPRAVRVTTWLLIALFLVAILLVAWAAFTLGNPARDLPRRPLPYPKHRTIPKHAQWRAQDEVVLGEHRLVPEYVDMYTPPPAREPASGEHITWRGWGV